MPPCGSPYRAVLHAVAIDGMYDSSAEIVAKTLAESLRQAASLGARTVAMTALATGYGRLSMVEFAAAVQAVFPLTFPGLEQVTLAIRSADDLEELYRLVPMIGAEVVADGPPLPPRTGREAV